jgi:hypothetical protein
MQERTEARQEKVRLEEEIVSYLIWFSNYIINFLSQLVTSKRYDEQEKANQLLKKSFSQFKFFFLFFYLLSISRDVDLATHKVSESEMQLRTMFRVEL